MRIPFVAHTLAVAVFVASLVGAPALAPAIAAGLPGAVSVPPDTTSILPGGLAVPDSLMPEEPPASLPNRVTVYYFHRTLRCDTCLKFEAYTDEAIRSSFESELNSGVLEWRVVNLDDPGNEHFVDDYYITESSVIAVEFRDEEQSDWANLDAIWGLVGDKPAFLSYIRSAVEVRLVRVRDPEPTHSAAPDSVAQPDEKPVRR